MGRAEKASQDDLDQEVQQGSEDAPDELQAATLGDLEDVSAGALGRIVAGGQECSLSTRTESVTTFLRSVSGISTELSRCSRT